MGRFVATLLLCVCAFNTTASADQLRKLQVVYTAATDMLPAFVAKDDGIFAQNGLDVTLTMATLQPNVVPVLLSGDAQIGIASPPRIVTAADSGLDLVVVSGETRVLASNPTISLIAREGVKVTSPGDLKGKRIGVPGLGGMVELVFREWLTKQSLPQNAVTLTEVALPQTNDLLRAGTIDAAIAVEPMRTRAVENRIGYLAAEFFSDINPDALGLVWMAKRDWASQNADAIERFRHSLDQAIDTIHKDPQAARAIEFRYLHLNAPRLPDWNTVVTAADLDFFVRLLQKSGQLGGKVDAASLIVTR